MCERGRERMAGSLPGSGGRVGRGDSVGLGVDVLQVPSCHLCQLGFLGWGFSKRLSYAQPSKKQGWVFLGSCSLWQDQLGAAAKALNTSSEGGGHCPVVGSIQGLTAEAGTPKSE